MVKMLIDQTFRGYLLAAKNRVYILEMCDMAHRLNDPEDAPKIPTFISQATALARMCEGMSNELQKLHELQERIQQFAQKEFRLVIEHVESPWRPEYARPADTDTPADTQDADTP
jgi:hypothetical protein